MLKGEAGDFVTVLTSQDVGQHVPKRAERQLRKLGVLSLHGRNQIRPPVAKLRLSIMECGLYHGLPLLVTARIHDHPKMV